jgi:hypothetical protein
MQPDSLTIQVGDRSDSVVSFILEPDPPACTLAPREPHEVVHEALLLYIINFPRHLQSPSSKTPIPPNKINGFKR